MALGWLVLGGFALAVFLGLGPAALHGHVGLLAGALGAFVIAARSLRGTR